MIVLNLFLQDFYMQKKLFFLIGIINCGINYAQENAQEELKQEITRLCEDHFGRNDEVLAEYKKRLKIDYDVAFIKAITAGGDKQAIEDKFKDNKSENASKELEKNNLLDDGKPGYYPSVATTNSVKGILQGQWALLRQKQDEENEKHKQEYAQYEADFNEHVRPVMINKLVERRYTLFVRYSGALNECGNDERRLKSRDISWKKLQKPCFLPQQNSEMYADIYALAKARNIPITERQLIAIAATIKLADNQELADELKGKTLVEQIELGEHIVTEKVRILNQQGTTPRIDLTAKDGQELDIKDDQNDQGALSQ